MSGSNEELNNNVDILHKMAETWHITEFVVLTKEGKQNLEATNGLLRKTSGEGISVKIYTPKMIAQDATLVTKIDKWVKERRLGGLDEKGIFHFHQDIATLMNDNQTFVTKNCDMHPHSSSIKLGNVETLTQEEYEVVKDIINSLKISEDQSQEINEENNRSSLLSILQTLRAKIVSLPPLLKKFVDQYVITLLFNWFAEQRAIEDRRREKREEERREIAERKNAEYLKAEILEEVRLEKSILEEDIKARRLDNTRVTEEQIKNSLKS
jgi:hypothetical protein